MKYEVEGSYVHTIETGTRFNKCEISMITTKQCCCTFTVISTCIITEILVLYTGQVIYALHVQPLSSEGNKREKENWVALLDSQTSQSALESGKHILEPKETVNVLTKRRNRKHEKICDHYSGTAAAKPEVTQPAGICNRITVLDQCS